MSPSVVPHRSLFGQTLRAELDRQGVSIRGLAKRLSPHDPVGARRNLTRWVGGYNRPTPRHRRAVAVALGLPEDFFAEDDEEADPVVALVAVVRRIVRDEVDQRMRVADGSGA